MPWKQFFPMVNSSRSQDSTQIHPDYVHIESIPPTEGERFLVKWTENHSTSLFPVDDQHFSVIATKEETIELLRYLETKGSVFTHLDIESYVPHDERYPKAPDGHVHIVDGEPQMHMWADCPNRGERIDVTDQK